MMGRVCLVLSLTLCACSGGGTGGDTTRIPVPGAAAGSRADDASPGAARRALLAAYADHHVVAIGVLSYANRDLDDFILDLLRDTAFPERVSDVVVECGNSLYQPVLDRYVRGDSVPLAEVRQVWRNPTQPFCGVTTFYETLFPLVRRINQALAPDRRLRVLAADPPVDWQTVRTSADLVRFRDRDANIAAVVEREVLAKHRTALMIFGARHLLHGGGGAVAMSERAGHRNATFVVVAHNGFAAGSPASPRDDSLERRLAAWPVPSLATLRDTWLGDLPLASVLPGAGRGRLAAAADAYLYLGPAALMLRDPIPAYVVLDTAYMAELGRRAAVRRGPLGPDAILREAADAGAFFNDAAPGGPSGAAAAHPKAR